VRTDYPDPVAEADALIAAGKAAEAAANLQHLLAQGRGGILMRLALARALSASGDHSAALECVRDTATLAPDLPSVAIALGDVLLRSGHLPTAIGEYQRALRIDPDSGETRLKLAQAWLEAGEAVRAKEMLAQISGAEGLTDVIARETAQADAMLSAPRAHANYVRHLFDQFSTDYDQRMLQTLMYRGHLILREFAAMVLGTASNLTILDLGCGTGLAGREFRALASRLDGIDLSPAMVDAAKQLQIYDALVVGDLETPLLGAQRYDLAIAADTLVYLGDLAPALEAVARTLKPEGFFLFTTEREEDPERAYSLGPKRRWRHSADYLRNAAARAGFEMTGLLECSPRVEAGAPVAGWAVALQLRTGVP